MRIRTLWAGALSALPAWALAAGPWATVTIVEGQALLMRDAATFALAEGVRLSRDDILQVGPSGRFVRVEFHDGVIMDMGPGTRLLLSPPSRTRGKPSARAYLQQGVVKLGAPAGKTPQEPLLLSPPFELSAMSRGAVVRVGAKDAAVFAESGDLTLAERRDGKPQPPLALRNGQFYLRSGDSRAQVTGRPGARFIEALPRSFLDTLPSRLGHWAARDVTPRRIGSLGYEDAQPWIDAEPPLRAAFVTRWRPLARDPDFRAGLLADMNAHPEWDRVLFPEKYRPKPPVVPAVPRVPAAASTSASPSPSPSVSSQSVPSPAPTYPASGR